MGINGRTRKQNKASALVSGPAPSQAPCASNLGSTSPQTPPNGPYFRKAAAETEAAPAVLPPFLPLLCKAPPPKAPGAASVLVAVPLLGAASPLVVAKAA